LSGCATIIEVGKGIAGLSTKTLEDNRPQALTKVFKYNYNTAYGKAKKILQDIGSYIYAEDFKRHLLAVYLSAEDTTPVGVFLKEIDAENTQLEISSPSISAKEYLARRVFARMAGLVDPEEKQPETKLNF
jgi:hypothetical protein